jgi:hypothetical protein
MRELQPPRHPAVDNTWTAAGGADHRHRPGTCRHAGRRAASRRSDRIAGNRTQHRRRVRSASCPTASSTSYPHPSSPKPGSAGSTSTHPGSRPRSPQRSRSRSRSRRSGSPSRVHDKSTGDDRADPRELQHPPRSSRDCRLNRAAPGSAPKGPPVSGEVPETGVGSLALAAVKIRSSFSGGESLPFGVIVKSGLDVGQCSV